MRTRANEIIKRIIPVLHKAGVTRAALFGSYVRGEAAEESDIDILVDLPEDKSLLDLIELKFQLEEALKRKVDVLTYDAVHPLLKPYIEEDQVQIL